jgi:hypothetical protein
MAKSQDSTRASRRTALTMLASTAAVATAMPVAQAFTSDPIFAPIEAHKATLRNITAVCHMHSELEGEFAEKTKDACDAYRAYLNAPRVPSQYIVENDEWIMVRKLKNDAPKEVERAAPVRPDFDDTPEGAAVNVRLDTAWEDANTTAIAVLTTPPTTLAGIVAVLKYANEAMFGEDDRFSETILVDALHSGGELFDAGAAFLPMIADTIVRLAPRAA